MNVETTQASGTVARRPGRFAGLRSSSWLRSLGVPVVLLLLGLLGSGNDYLLHLATAAAVAYVLTSAFNLIYGYAGIFNLAIVMLYGIGAFTSVFLVNTWDLSFWLALPAAVALSAAMSVLVALPSKKLSELFLAIQTLAFALALGEILKNWEDFSGGTIGIYAISSPTFFGIDLLGGTPPFYWFTAVVAALVFLLMRRIHFSGMGRKLTALREGPRVLASVGVSPDSTRLVAFGLSGGLAGLAGVLYAHFQLVIGLETFSFDRLVGLLLATILGGAGYLYGPVLGVLAIVVMDEVSLATSQAQDLVYGLGILVLVVATSGGLAGALHRLVMRLGRRRPRIEEELVAPPAAEERPKGPRIMGLDGTEERRRLEVLDILVTFGGTVAVQDVSLTVSTGEVVGLIGPNGAGKTTLLNAITGDVRATSGSVLLDGEPVLGHRQQDLVRAGVGRTFQSPKVIPELTVVENVMLAADSDAGIGWMRQTVDSPRALRHDRDARERAMSLLADFSLQGRADHLTHDQPYGVLRLIEIARNLMLNPSFLLLDEPGAGLTEYEREEVARTIRALSEREIGVVLVDHNLPLIHAACDRIYVLDVGSVIAEGAPAEVFSRAGVISAYLGVPA